MLEWLAVIETKTKSSFLGYIKDKKNCSNEKTELLKK
jgi:hypothetical protein